MSGHVEVITVHGDDLEIRYAALVNGVQVGGDLDKSGAGNRTFDTYEEAERFGEAYAMFVICTERYQAPKGRLLRLRFTYLTASEIGICADGIGLIFNLGRDDDGAKEPIARQMIERHHAYSGLVSALETIREKVNGMDELGSGDLDEINEIASMALTVKLAPRDGKVGA